MKIGNVIKGAEQLSLGISIVVAILLGVGIGLWLKSIFEQTWLLWLGVFWGIAAAGLNIFRAYKKQFTELEKLKEDPKYKNYQPQKDDEDDE